MTLHTEDEKLLKKANNTLQNFGEMAPETREKILIGLLSDPMSGYASDALNQVTYVTSLFGEAGLPIKTQEDADEAQLFFHSMYHGMRVEEEDEKQWQKEIRKYIKECEKNNDTPTFRGAHNLVHGMIYKEPRTNV